MSATPRIVVLDAFTADQGQPAWDRLRELGELTVHPRTPSDQIIARCRDCTAVLTNKVPLDAATIAALPMLRYIGVMATGTNIVDLAACRARAIAVSNVPGYSTDSVAQLVIALVLHFTNDVARHSDEAKNGTWAQSADFCFFTKPLHELAGKTLAVIGRGAIGARVETMARGLGMEAIAAAVPGSTTRGRVPLADALACADVVSLHCPLTDHTRHLVDRAFLAAMRDHAILVNTGRGALIDETALVEALAAGRLGGVGLDVLSQEPPPRAHPLLDPRTPWARRVAVTPHIGWGTVEARRRLADAVTENLAAFMHDVQRNRVV